MVLELDRHTQLFPYPVSEQPSSIEYRPESVIERIFCIEGAEPVLTDISLKLFRRSVKNTVYSLPSAQISIEMWDEARSLTNRFLANEELRIADPESWRILKKILMGNFDPQRTLEEINGLGMLGEEIDQWKLLESLTLIKKNTQDEDRNHVYLAGNANRTNHL